MPECFIPARSDVVVVPVEIPRRLGKSHFNEMRLQREVESLREIIAERDAELRALRAAIGSPGIVPALLGLTPLQNNLLRALHAAGAYGMTYEALLRAVDTTPASMKVHICRVRKVLKCRNSLADIESEFGQGYRLNEQARLVVQDALAEGQPIKSGV